MIANAAIVRSTRHEMPQIENTTFSKRESRMLGFNLDSWNNIIIISLAIAAAAAVVVGVSTYAVIRLQKLEAKEAADELSKYKVNVAAQVAESQLAIAQARQQGDEAKSEAAHAIERAAGLEKEAAVAKLEHERLKAQIAWRVIPAGNAAELEKSLASKPGSVIIMCVDNDPEASGLAEQLKQIFAKANWQVTLNSARVGNEIIFGIRLPQDNGADSITLRESFATAKMPFVEAWPTAPAVPAPGGVSMMVFSTGRPGRGAMGSGPMLFVGSRRPQSP
jgi:hypothetical protein